MTAEAGTAGVEVAEHLGAVVAAFEGRPAGPPVVAPDAVNQPMIRHWVEAMDDHNPVYVDEEAALAAGFSGVVAPPAMLQAWTMRGYRQSMEVERARRPGAEPVAAHGSSDGGGDGLEELFAFLDEAGFTSVVATDCEQEYLRPLVLGDRLTARSVIETVSAQKRTSLGPGHFVTTRTDYTDEAGALVATMRFRILRFRPSRPSRPAPSAPSAPSAPQRPLRPRPAITADNAFFFEGARQGRLLVQRCSSCGRLRHPPAPACAACRSLEWEASPCSGRATLYSFVVVHHPQAPAFDYPLVVGLAELEEGTRLVADLVGVAPEDVRIGMDLRAEFVAVDPELTLPVFRPAESAAAAAGAVASGRGER